MEHGVLKDQWEPRLLHSAPPGGYRTGSESWINQISGGSWLRFSRSSSEDAIRCNAAVSSKLQVVHAHYSCLHVSSLSQCNNPGLRRVHKDGRCETCRGALFLLSFTEPVVLCSICHSGGKYCKLTPAAAAAEGDYMGTVVGFTSTCFPSPLLPITDVCVWEKEKETLQAVDDSCPHRDSQRNWMWNRSWNCVPRTSSCQPDFAHLGGKNVHAEEEIRYEATVNGSG